MSNNTTKYDISSLAANLTISTDGNPVVIAVVGCSEVKIVDELALSIARRYAEDDERVIVLGCGRISVQEQTSLGVSVNSGVTAFTKKVAGKGDTPVSSIENGVDVVSYDEDSDKFDEIVASGSFASAVEELAKKYDHVVIAAPYAHETVDAAIASRLADVAMLVAVSGKTRRKKLKRASDALKRANANIAGVCLVDLDG